MTRDGDRVGRPVVHLAVFVLRVVWFPIVPARRSANHGMVFGILAQPSIILLLGLTGGLPSEYFPFALLLAGGEMGALPTPWST